MIIVNRKDFIAYTEGVLLDRNAEGNCIIGDNVNHEEAEAALERGEKIGLAVDGRLFSVLEPGKDGYVERKIDEV